MGVGSQRHAPAALPPGKTRYPLYRRLGGPKGRSGRARKISPPPGFDPQTVQPVASCYTDCAIPAPRFHGVVTVMTGLTRFPRIKIRTLRPRRRHLVLHDLVKLRADWRQQRSSCAIRKILLWNTECNAITTGIFKKCEIELRIYKVTAVLPTLQVKFGSTLYSLSYKGIPYSTFQVMVVLSAVQAKVTFCRRTLFTDVLSLKQAHIRTHEWDAPTVLSAQPIKRKVKVCTVQTVRIMRNRR
jgi:hypothetical protein